MNIGIKKILAWSAHLFTSLGLLAAFMAITSIDREDWRCCFIWLFICFIIDSLDGTFARLVNVEKILPEMDGKSIDFVIDFAAYALIPAYFFYKAEMATETLMIPSLIIILISSALYYGKKNMVEDNQYFIGFPVLWNFVVFFQFFVFQNNQLLNFLSVLLFGVLHFIPLRYAYPSRTKKYFIFHLLMSLIGLSGTLGVLILYPDRMPVLEWASLAGLIYFGIFALFDSNLYSKRNNG